ncbi:hypothetical protein [Alkalihalobacillus deserti]|uniref:hypothetical protein n=1 Tax=Alkalihalobacillus deserti TaxID=2879466 RepID=UPI001D137EB1|nr:hypothetical protein [Alkalihalobacillus deserti]
MRKLKILFISLAIIVILFFSWKLIKSDYAYVSYDYQIVNEYRTDFEEQIAYDLMGIYLSPEEVEAQNPAYSIRTNGGYKVKGLIGLEITAPYLHDGELRLEKIKRNNLNSGHVNERKATRSL